MIRAASLLSANRITILAVLAGWIGAPAVHAQTLPASLLLTNITIQGQARTLALYQRSVRATNFHYLTWTSAGGYATNPPPQVRTYRGTVIGQSNTIVCAVIKPGGLLQADGFDYEQGKSYTWQINNEDVASQLPAGTFAAPVAAAASQPDQAVTKLPSTPPPAPDAPCGNPACNDESLLPSETGDLIQPLGTLPRSTHMPPAGGMQLFDLGVDITHYRYVQTYGGNADLAVSSIEHTVNIYDLMMARDALISVQESVVVLREDIFYVPTGMGDQLNDMMTAWKAAPLSALPWDQVHSFQTEQGLFGAGGYAWGNSIGKDESPACVEALYHEAGHNWDVVHIVYGADTMGGNRPNHGPFSIDRLLRKRDESITEGDLVPFPGTYPDPLPPYTHVDCASTLTNTFVNVNVLTNDWDGNGNALTVVGFSTNTLKGGTVTWISNGILRYTPAANYVGKDLFAYTVRDTTGLRTRDLVHVEVINRDLAVHYAFEESTGKSATDSTGNNHPGKLQGATDFSTSTEPGVSGQALRVDGGGIICDNSPLMPADAPVAGDFNYWPFDSERMARGNFFDPMDESCTIAFWFKAYDTTTSRGLLKKEWHTEQRVGFSLTASGSGFSATVREFNGLSNTKTFGWTTALAAARWYHVALQFDRAANLARLYVDGVQRATATLDAGRFIFQGRQPLLLGEGAGGQVVFDEFRYYTKALTAVEIQALYAVGQIPASGPSPADEERDVALSPTLAWVAGRTNYQHDVFFGTNQAAVTAATTNAPEYLGRRPVANYTNLPALLPSQTYFWRVDEILGGTNVAPGTVWSFTTAPDAIHGGLKLQFTLDARDTLGNVTYDRAGPAFNDGTLMNAPTAIAGQVAEARQFNGTSQYVEAPALNLVTDTMTFLAWVRRNGSVNNYSGLVFHRGSQTSGMNISTANRLGYHWNDTAGSYNHVGPDLPDSQWALCAVVVEPTRAYLYVGTTDGVLTRTTNIFPHALSAFDGVLRVASDSGSSSRYFNGALDEVGVWNRALTREEIGAILTNGISGGGIDGPPPAPQPGTFTWTGNADNLWNNSGNWSAAAVPGASNLATFDESSARNLATDLGPATAVAGVRITGKLRALGIAAAAGSDLTLGTNGLTLSNSFTTLSLAAPVTLAGRQTWQVSEFATLNLASNLNNAGHALTLANAGSVNLNGVLSGTGGLTNTGAGRTYLNRLNPYSGPTAVLNGEVVLNNWSWPDGRVVGTGTLIIGANGWVRTAQPHVFSAYGSNPIRIFGGRLTFGAEAYVNASFEMTGGTFDGTGEWRMNGNPTFRAAALPAVVSVPVNAMNAARTFTVENGTADPDFVLSGKLFNCPDFAKAGPGKLQIKEPVEYSAGILTNRIHAGILSLDAGRDTLPSGTMLTNAAGAQLWLNNHDQVLGGLTGSGSVQLGYGTLTLSLTSTQTFGGIISGSPNGSPPPSGNTEESPNPGGFTKSGTGKVTLTASQTFTGDTLVTAGILALSGSGGLSASSNLVISAAAILDVTAKSGGSLPLAAGQKLKGRGTVVGGVAVNNFATLAPGDSVGTLTTGAETWAGGGSYEWEITHATTPNSSDRLAINGALTVTATAGNPFVLRLISPAGPLPGFNSVSNYVWTLATTTGGVAGFDPAKFNVNAAGLGVNPGSGSFSVSTQANNVVIQFTAYAPPPTPPQITGYNLAPNGSFALSGLGTAGQPYVLVATTNLTPPVLWTALTTNTAGGGGGFTLGDAQATNHPLRFYRVRTP